MSDINTKLLVADAVINLLLGVLLLLFPFGIGPALGVPLSESSFYPTLLGAVLFGIGIALLLDAFGRPRGIRGLGLAGAIAINFCGAGVLAVWLIFCPLNLPLRGYVILWVIAVAVFVIGTLELMHRH